MTRALLGIALSSFVTAALVGCGVPTGWGSVVYSGK